MLTPTIVLLKISQDMTVQYKFFFDQSSEI